VAGNLTSIERQVRGKRNFDAPPLHLWSPALSGDIPIVISKDGRWFHDGGLIERESLVRLFASILRREDDGEYYLVTPVEKWRIEVEAHALVVTDVERAGDQLVVTLSTGRQAEVGAEYSLFLDPDCDNVAAIRLWHGLTALFNRNAWYRLVALAGEDLSVTSGDYRFSLKPE
jgi:hypothetical protein